VKRRKVERDIDAEIAALALRLQNQPGMTAEAVSAGM
jgi:hypothetical protein